MATYTRVGSFLLAQELAQDPFGGIHRGIQTAGAAFDRHMLVRTFSEEFVHQGMGTKAADVGRIIPLLGGSRAFGQGYRYEGGKAPHCACDYIPGRSLAQLIEKSKHEQIPFGVDHALSVIQGVAQGIVQMHAKGVSHGVLSPHSIWLSFEGGAHILDAPYASAMRAYLSKCPAAENWLAAYLQMPNGNALQQDLFGIGAILFELLTFEKLPLGPDLFEGALNRATLKAAQEEGPLPAEIKAFLGRLLLGREPFHTTDAFNAELERVLYDGDYSPTTFNMAFFMHTLFREENDKDTSAIKHEQSDNYMAYTAAGENLRSGAARAQHIEGFQAEEGEEQKGMKKGLMIGGGVAAAAVVLALFFAFRGRGQDPEVQRQLAELAQIKAKMEMDKADQEAKQRAEQEKQQQLQQQLAETKDVAAKAALQKQLEESQKRQAEIEAKKAELAKQAKAAEEQSRRIAQASKQPEPKPEPPKPEPPKPAAQQPPPQQAAQQPAPQPSAPQPQAPAMPQPTAPTGGGADVPVGIVSKAVPRFPPQARAMMMANKDYVVRVKVFVDETGNPMKASIVQGVGGAFGFDDAAQEAAMRSSFTPAQKAGQASRGTVELDYHFKK
ncbi:MAG TPA: TonB family protein [Holophagaceae bacterium]|nr:TonB family protein [Holophagaceae bacterium]